jgi:DNA-directed RNA polymerase specialized sigma24 family protein
MRADGGSIRAGPPFVAKASRAVVGAWRKFEPAVARMAERMTDDQDEREDLVQEAMIALWKADPTRFDLRDQRDVRYLHKILVHRMWKVRGEVRNRLSGEHGTAWVSSRLRLDERGSVRHGDPDAE